MENDLKEMRLRKQSKREIMKAGTKTVTTIWRRGWGTCTGKKQRDSISI